MSTQTNTPNEARLFPFVIGKKIKATDKDFWKFPLSWVLGIRLKREMFEDTNDNFYSATVKHPNGKMYLLSMTEAELKRIFPTRKTASFKPEKCLASCIVTPKDDRSNDMVGLDGIRTDDISFTIVGPDFPRNLVCQQLAQIKEQLNSNFDFAKTIASLAIEWCDSTELTECDRDL